MLYLLYINEFDVHTLRFQIWNIFVWIKRSNIYHMKSLAKEGLHELENTKIDHIPYIVGNETE